MYVERAFTVATIAEIHSVISTALATSPVASHLYSRELVDILTAQVAIETADGTRMVCWNLGNARPRPGENWTSFRTREVIDGVERIVDGSKFAAYPSLAIGAAAFIDLLWTRYAPALNRAADGDAVAYSLELRRLGYYTADAGKYADALVARIGMVKKMTSVPDGPVTSLVGRAVSWFRGLLASEPEQVAHGYRCSVAELVADAKKLGTWRSKSSGYVPKRGDLIVSARGGQEPENGGSGHVERVVSEDTHAPKTIGGNEVGDTWVLAPFDLAQPSLRGFIVVPPNMGSRAVDVAMREYASGVRETPGESANKRIQEYHAGARRGGSPRAGMPGFESEGVATLGPKASDEIAWCASSASWCQREGLR